jgi:prolyl 4-hydroxylase
MKNQRGSVETVLSIDKFLSPSSCTAILDELQFAFWRPSTVVRRGAGDKLVDERSEARVSETTTYEWFSRPLRRRISAIERRLEGILPGMREHYESWQATRYRVGGQFDFHYDGGHWIDQPAGDRAFTVLLYLQAPRRGGATVFRELDLQIPPQVGRLVVWRNLDEHGIVDQRMIHAGAPVRAGCKTILVNWIRERSIAQSSSHP